jgi:transposase
MFGREYVVRLRQAMSRESNMSRASAVRGRKTIAGGRAAVRAGLYMAALVASRSDPVIAPFYQKLRSSGKTGKQALTACMRKLLVILNGIMRD